MLRNLFYSMMVLAISLHSGVASSAPIYGSEKARSLIDTMVTAHGGYDTWLQADAIQFTFMMYLAVLPIADGRTAFDNWRFYSVTMEPKSSRGFVDIPFQSNEGPEIAFDGTNSWVVPYEFDQPRFRDAPSMMLWLHYGMINLPFLTQVEGVHLEHTGQESLLEMEQQFEVVRMTFSPKDKVHQGFVELFIDPETSLLKAWKQGTRLPLLPGDVLPKEFRTGDWSTLRIIDEYVEFDGLTIARGYSSHNEETGEVTGAHLVLDPVLLDEFDEASLARPANATSYDLFPAPSG